MSGRTPRSTARGSLLRAILLLLLAAAWPARAEKTLMWLVDWYEGFPGNTDSLMRIDSVYVPHNTGTQGYYNDTKDQMLVQTGAYAPWIPVNGTIPDTQIQRLNIPTEMARYWFALPNYNSANYREGKVRVYWKYRVAKHRIITNPLPNIQLDTAIGRGSTSELNSPSTREIDRCVDSLPGDTVWIQHVGTISNNPGATAFRCYDHNPFFTKVGTIHLQNPWPGRSAFVQFNGIWHPLYQEDGRPGWVSTTLYADPRVWGAAGTLPKLPVTLRFASSDPGQGGSIQYMGQSGIGGATVAPFDLSTANMGWERWIQPPVNPGTPSTVSTTAPKKTHTLMIRRPNWGATSIRIGWKGLDARFIPNATPLCEWFAYTIYENALPASLALFHPYQDSVFGTQGALRTPSDLSAWTGWISTVPITLLASTDTVWMNVVADRPSIAGSKPTNAADLTRCDTKTLAFRAYDWDKAKTTWNFAFAEGSRLPLGVTVSTDNCPNSGGGVTKGLVKPDLGTDGLPQWSGKKDCDIYGTSDDPRRWFMKDPVVNNYTCVPEKLTLQSDGYYSFNSQSYFPLNNFVNPNNPGGGATNFGFCMHAKATFEYVQGLQFQFRGDDDVWVFIDKKLALDLGGQHGPISGDIKLDKLGLSEGKAYQFDMFYCERHATGSSMLIKTTMNLVPTLDYRFDSTSTASSTTTGNARAFTIKLQYVESVQDASVCTDATTQNLKLGRGDISIEFPDGTRKQVDPNDPTLGVYLGLTPSRDLSTIQVNLDSLPRDPKLNQRGTYKLRIAFQNNPAFVKEWEFEKPFGATDLTVDILDGDGDGQADSAVFHGQPNPFQAGTLDRIVVPWANAAGARDSVVVPVASAVLGGDSVLSVKFAPFQRRTLCPTAGCAGGRVSTTIGGGTDNLVKTINDRVAPVPDSARLSYGQNGAPDTLTFYGSEGLIRNPGAVRANDSAWARTGRPSAAAAAQLARATGNPTISPDGRKVVLLLPANHSVVAGDSLRLAGFSADGMGNSPAALVSPKAWVPIASEARGSAALFDRNGDGAADSIAFQSKGSLSDIASVTINWCDASGVADQRVIPVSGLGTGLRLPTPFALGATACPAAKSVSLTGGQALTFPLFDSVPAVAVRARYRFGETLDTLVVKLSEAMISTATTAPWFDVGRPHGAFRGQPATSSKLSSPDSAVLLIDPALGPGSGESALRLVVAPATRLLQDARGNTTRDSSRWVPIEFGPIPLVGALSDSDGDGRADRVSIRPVRLPPTPYQAATFDLTWTGTGAGAAKRKIAASSLTFQPATGGWIGPVSPAFDRGATGCAVPGACSGLMIDALMGTYPFLLADSIAPVADSARIVFGLNGQPDTLIVHTAEALFRSAVTRPGDAVWARTGRPSQAAAAGVQADAVPSNGGRTLVLVLPAGHGVIAGDSLRLAGLAGDSAGNAPAATVAPLAWVPIKAVPRGTSALFDRNGDGQADEITIAGKGDLSTVTSIVVRWNNAAGVADERTIAVAGAQTSHALPVPFGLAATSCRRTEGCSISLVAGTETWTFPLHDSVPGVAIRAHYRFGTAATDPDTMTVRLSEPMSAAGSDQPWFAIGRPSAGATGLIARSSNLLTTDSAILLVEPARAPTVVQDSLRLVVAPETRLLKDAQGNIAGAASPWVPIAFGPAPVIAALFDGDADGRADRLVVRPVRESASPGALSSFSIAWTDTAGKADRRTIAAVDLAFDVATGSWSGGIGQPFQYGATGCEGTCGGSVTTTSGDIIPMRALLDSVAPIALRAELRYPLPGVSEDTLLVAISEKWLGELPNGRFLDSALVTTGKPSAPVDLRGMLSWSLSSNGRSIVIILPDSIAPGEGDSLRLAGPAARVRDTLGNAPGVDAPWVPIIFGLRPPFRAIGPWPSFQNNKGANAWPPPAPGTPPMSMFVRPVKGTADAPVPAGDWTPVGGGKVVADETKMLGVLITLNRPLRGNLYIYDNMGIHVTSLDLEPLLALWKGEGKADQAVQVWLTWNGTRPTGLFAPGGVYLFRLVAWTVSADGGALEPVNQVWKLGWSH